MKQPDSNSSLLAGQQVQQAPGSGEQQKENAGQAEDGTHFKQVYWVCDAAWPTDAQEQVRPGSSEELELVSCKWMLSPLPYQSRYSPPGCTLQIWKPLCLLTPALV